MQSAAMRSMCLHFYQPRRVEAQRAFPKEVIGLAWVFIIHGKVERVLGSCSCHISGPHVLTALCLCTCDSGKGPHAEA